MSRLNLKFVRSVNLFHLQPIVGQRIRCFAESFLVYVVLVWKLETQVRSLSGKVIPLLRGLMDSTHRCAVHTAHQFID